MITKSIERAQKKVEENNFGIRKRLLEYDDVMNSQREVIYTKRRHALFGERIQLDISNMMQDTCETIMDEYHDAGDFEGFKLELLRIFSTESPFTEEEFLRGSADELAAKLFEEVWTTYNRKVEAIAKQAFPVIKDVFENKGEQYTNIVVPISDGQRTFQITTNLEKAYETKGVELMRSFEKTIMLVTIDEAWKEHLRELDDLRTAVQNASYEQKDPLLIYKFESFDLFKKMIENNNRNVVSTIVKAYIPIQDSSGVQQARERRRMDFSRLKTQKDEFTRSSGGGEGEKEKPKKLEPVRVEKKVGRNDPCPCGSGKKYKHCHGKGL
jgi:preprotein translocase subunit SecA